MMGMSNSKFGKQTVKDVIEEGSIPSTEFSTPKIFNNKELDPRSPSTNFARTPLELLSQSANEEGDTPIRDNQIVLGIDPRSPTTEFKRTPIVLSASDNNLSKKIFNKNLEKVIRSEGISVKGKNKKNLSSSLKIRTPKLLDSSPVQPKPVVHKRRSFAGLLETNIDFTETDINVAFQQKCKINNLLSNGTCEECVINDKNVVDDKSVDSEEMIGPVPNENEQSTKESSFTNKVESHMELPVIETSTNQQTLDVKLFNLIEQNIEVTQIIDEDGDLLNVSDEILLNLNENKLNNKHVDICLEPVSCISVSTNIKEVDQISNICESAGVTFTKQQKLQNSVSEDLVNNKQDSVSGILSPEFSNSKLMKFSKPVPFTPNVKELDRKLTDLIYEDEHIICPRVVKYKDFSERSPMRSLNGNDMKRNCSKLKVSDKPSKTEYTSKIPVYREKSKKIIEHENTPPMDLEWKQLKAKKYLEQMNSNQPRQSNKNECKTNNQFLWDNANTTLYL